MRIERKRVIACILTVLLAIIETIKHDMSPIYWLPIVNVSIVIILVFVISNEGIKKFINVPTAVCTVACVAGAIVLRFHWRNHIGEYLYWQVVAAIINIWAIAVIAIGYLIRMIKTKERLFKPGIIAILWILFSVLSSVHKNQYWSITIFFAFGCFYLTKFHKNDWYSLWEGVFDGLIISFLGMQFVSLAFRPYTTFRYSGAFVNPNDTATFYVIVFAALLSKMAFLWEKARQKRSWKIVLPLLAAWCSALIFYTMGRTAYIAAMLIMLFFAVFIMGRRWKIKPGKIILRLGAFLLCFIVMIPVVYMLIRYCPAAVNHRVWLYSERTQEDIDKWNSGSDDRYVSTGELADKLILKFVPGLENKKSEEKKKEEHKEVVLPEPSDTCVIVRDDLKVSSKLPLSLNIRIATYKEYLRYSSLFGEINTNRHFCFASNGETCWHSQNLWIQITYEYGYIAGGILLLLTLLIIIRAFKTAVKGQNAISVIPLLFTTVFMVIGLMEVVWLPGLVVLELFLMVQHPVQYQIDEETESQ